MKFDDILWRIGEFGTYQRRVFALVCLLIFPTSWPTLIQVFAMGHADHWCKIPSWNITMCEDLGYDTASCNDISLRKLTSIPLVETQNGSDVTNEIFYHKCVRYNRTDISLLSTLVNTESNNGTIVAYLPEESASRDVMSCDHGWEYDRSVYTRTVIQEHNLVCGRERYVQMPQSVHYAGYLVANLIFGVLADTIGRYKTLLIALMLNIISGLAQLVSSSYWMFVIIRFFQGMGTITTSILCFIIGTEFVGTSKRSITGIFINVPYAMGSMTLAGIAYFIRDWRYLNIVLTVPWIILLVCMIFLPESPRWLLSQGKKERAKKTIRKAAAVNGVHLPHNHLEDDVYQLEHANKEREDVKKATPLDIFRYPNMRCRTILLIYLWSACVVVYHGFNLSTGTLGINVFISFFISGAMEIPAYLLSMLVIERPRVGRRRPTIIAFFLGGFACLATIFIAPGPVRASIAMLGKFGITAAFGIVYLLTAELFPTPLRSVGVGLCSMASRVANILAPLILLTSQYWEPTPLVIFGSATVLAGLLTGLLPETRGKKMPENIADVERFGRTDSPSADEGNEEDKEFDDSYDLDKL